MREPDGKSTPECTKKSMSLCSISFGFSFVGDGEAAFSLANTAAMVR